MKLLIRTYLIASFFLVAIFVVGLFAATPRQSCREKAINETLQMTLLVGADMRAKGLHPTWEQIQIEVRKRLGVDNRNR